MKENIFNKMGSGIRNAVLSAGIVAGSTAPSLEAQQASANVAASELVKSSPQEEAVAQKRADYQAGKWINSEGVINSGVVDEDQEAFFLSKKYAMKVMKPSYSLGRGMIVSFDMTPGGFVTFDAKSNTVVYLDMLNPGHPQKDATSPEFQEFAKSVVESDAIPADIKSLFKDLLSQ